MLWFEVEVGAGILQREICGMQIDDVLDLRPVQEVGECGLATSRK